MLKLKHSMEMAGTNLLNSLSPDDDFLPLWSVTIDPDLRARRDLRWTEHNVGRWWDALLRLEAATGFAIPAEMEAAMLRHLRGCLDNPLSICASMDAATSCFDDHSQREILLALAAVARWRDDEWAADAGHEMVLALDRFILGDGAWDRVRMHEAAVAGGRHVAGGETGTASEGGDCPVVELTTNHGRMIEGLLELYTATGDADALRLASRLAELHLEGSTRSDGTVPETNGYIHTHSLFGTFRGLLMYGRLTRQREYVDRVAKMYATTVREKVFRSGFISHDWGSEQKGETTSPGDAAQLALWLAQLGHGEFLDDAERIVRARILPSQITSPLGLNPADDEDSTADLDAVALGAFGGMHTHPHGGIHPTTDITAADLHSLCDIYTHVVEETQIGLFVNFHLDTNDDLAHIESARGERARITVRPKVDRPVFIRIPAWTSPGSVELEVNRIRRDPLWSGRFLMVLTPDAREIEVTFELPVETATETIDGDDYHLTWRGDDVIGLSPNTDFLPFYQTCPE